MLSRRSLIGFALTAVALVLPARFAAADNHDAPRIGTVNTAKVFTDMMETKDLRQKMDSDAKAIKDEGERREKALQELQKKRDLFNEGSTDYDKANKDLVEQAIATRAWQELTKAEVLRQQKMQMRNLFNKIEEATKDVATAKKLDLVFVDQKMELPTDAKTMEQITADQLRQLINQRTIIFNNGRLDITNEVLAAVDAKYKEKK
jgi:Skp family chaperone for outer membrane proteins